MIQSYLVNYKIDKMLNFGADSEQIIKRNLEKCKERCILSTLMPLYHTAKFRANLLYSYDSFDSILAKVGAVFSFHTRLSMQRMLDSSLFSAQN